MVWGNAAVTQQAFDSTRATPDVTHSAQDESTAAQRPFHPKSARRSNPLKHFLDVITHQEIERVFHAHLFLRSTEGDSFERSFSAFRATAEGRAILQTRPASLEILRNRKALRACPAGTFGRRYAEFADGYALDEAYYLDPQQDTGLAPEADLERFWFRDRVEAGHDIRHVLTGYRPDVMGETCLLMFRFGQLHHIGMFALAFLGMLHLRFTNRGPVFRTLLEAYRRGRSARLLDLLPWELGLDQPLAAHRRSLGLTAPRWYPSPFAPEAFPDASPHASPRTRQWVPVAGPAK